ncbi:rho-N domain-containing protein 1, chloroplastic [Amborella trichopoda]|nr:rho-N domain-containing protein 1, chloroplastic [Amborella trichopoda]|eukprot:XP_006857295.2 rho-N domain-containing protein 1, chloroplastic [Amborella trichopoda]
MSGAVKLSSSNLPGYGLSEGSQFPFGVSRRTVVSSYPYSNDFKYYARPKLSMRKSFVPGSRYCSLYVCAGDSGFRRNPDFSRQNRQGYRGRNRPNQERESLENLEDSEYISSKNGPLLSFSRSSKFQATSAPGARESEIVELFRKVQAQLRERAAIKEEKKVEASQAQGEKGTVDSLLKLLRKHSAQHGKKKPQVGDFDRELSETTSQLDHEKSLNLFDSNNEVKREEEDIDKNEIVGREEVEESETVSFARPASNFRRRSPVPRVKYQPVYSTENTSSSDLSFKVEKKSNKRASEPQPNLVSSTMDDEVYTKLSESSDEEPEEAKNELMDQALSEEREMNPIKLERELNSTNLQRDLNSMKLSELRALAKSRGVKGYSKLKKGELLGLLSEDVESY